MDTTRYDQRAFIIGITQLIGLGLYFYWLISNKETDASTAQKSIVFALTIGGLLWCYALYNYRKAKLAKQETGAAKAALVCLLTPLLAPIIFLLAGILL